MSEIGSSFCIIRREDMKQKLGEITMWVSRKQYQELEKRIADLEREVQSQQVQINYLRTNGWPPVYIRCRNCTGTRNNFSYNPGGGGLI